MSPAAMIVVVRPDGSIVGDPATPLPVRYVVHTATAGEVLPELSVLAAKPDVLVPTAFQSLPWLRALFDNVAPAHQVSKLLLTVCEARSGQFALALPLLIGKRGPLVVASIADLGLSDYCAPWIGPGAPTDAESVTNLYTALLRALPGVDLIRFEKMPRQIGDRPNPLSLLEAARSSRFNRNWLHIDTTVEAFVATRGKKYRKEAERARRRMEDIGNVVFSRATTPDEIDAAYRQLEAWQSERHRSAGHDYVLDSPENSRFYRALLHDTAATGEASIFTLSAGGEMAAVLLGVTANDTFTLIRIADGGEKWRQVSPGRMIVLDAMRALVAEGVRTFDLGIGDYPFKRWIGCQTAPLVDVAMARTWRARPAVWSLAVRQRLRSNQNLRAIAHKIKHLRRPASPSD